MIIDFIHVEGDASKVANTYGEHAVRINTGAESFLVNVRQLDYARAFYNFLGAAIAHLERTKLATTEEADA